jgi:GST-like protein
VFAKGKTDSYGEERYAQESRRILGVLDQRLRDRECLIGDYSIVDMATVPWVECLAGFYQGWDYLGMGEFEQVERWRKQVTARPGYQRGILVCKKG